MRHVYVRQGTPRLNGKVERSHDTDKEEFYQLIIFKYDFDISKKIKNWRFFTIYKDFFVSLKSEFHMSYYKLKFLVKMQMSAEVLACIYFYMII